MNIDRRFLDQCDLAMGPAIALAHGEERQRIMTLSPFAVPMEQGICIIQNPTGRMVFYGVSVSNLSLGIPECLVGYIAERATRETNALWKLCGYGLGITVSRNGDRWMATLGNTPLATFDTPHINGMARVTNLQLMGFGPSEGEDGFKTQMAALIERYL